MFVVRKYEERDVPACAKCFYESFFDCPLTEKDKIFLRDYAQVLIEKCSFTYVAESEGQVVGFIIGHYKKDFDKVLAKRHDVKPHYKAWFRCFFKFAFGGYKMSAPFKAQFDVFYKKLKENGKASAKGLARLSGMLLRSVAQRAMSRRCAYLPIRTLHTPFTKSAVSNSYGKSRIPSACPANRWCTSISYKRCRGYDKKIFKQLQKADGKIRQNDRECNEQRSCTSLPLGV